MRDFHWNVSANVIGGAIFALLAWWWIRHRGGICPLCGHYHPAHAGEELVG